MKIKLVTKYHMNKKLKFLIYNKIKVTIKKSSILIFIKINVLANSISK